MLRAIGRLNSEQRAEEKQAQRLIDAERLNAGKINRASLSSENNFFAALENRPSRIVAIGGRRISPA
jgi:hypothetical protein